MLLIKCVLPLKIINNTIYFQTICKKKREVREDNSSVPPPAHFALKTQILVIERGSDSSYTRQERPASPDDTPLHSCLLLTSLTLVFYQLKVTENREHEEELVVKKKKKKEKAGLTADKPQRLLRCAVWQNKNKPTHKY